MMSRPKDVKTKIVCYNDLSENMGLLNIERGFHVEAALKLM